jgi:hypothetical protein
MRSVNKYVIWCMLAITIFIAYRSHFFESDRARAHREAQRMQELKQEVQKNPNNREALDEIVDYLNGNWVFSRQYAAGTLRQLGPLAKPAVPDLIRALNCGENVVEREAAIALGAVSVGMPDAVEPLRRKLTEFKRDVAWFAAESLGEIGKPALVAMPDLEEVAKSPVSNMADSAKRALKELDAIKETEAAKSN